MLLQAYTPAIKCNRASDVNNVAFVCFLVNHDNVRPVMRYLISYPDLTLSLEISSDRVRSGCEIMRYFPICLDGKIPKNFSLVIL